MHLMDFPPLKQKKKNKKKKEDKFCDIFLLALRLPRLGKRELILVLFVRLIDLCLFGFVGFLYLLGSAGLRFVIVALPGLFSYLFFSYFVFCKQSQGSTSKERILYPWERILSFRVEIIRIPPPRPTPAQHPSFRVDPFSGGRHFF